MKENKTIVIVGGGLSGLTAAVHLSKIGLKVILIEKNEFPKHKVCGEYVSNEILPYLNWLSIDIKELNPNPISKFYFSFRDGEKVECDLPLGGFGVSRYVLDDFIYKKALENGCEVIQDSVVDIVFKNDVFEISTLSNKIFTAGIVLGAFGKRSNIDLKFKREFINKKSCWLAVKSHYSGNFPDGLVGLHDFEGGYCGVSKVENGIVNICYLVNYRSFKRYKNINDFQNQVVMKNPVLKSILENCKMIFDSPLTISQISFEKKEIIENHVLMIGDSAGLIHPFCGNGMAMAVHSAKIASDLISDFYFGKIKSQEDFEKVYIEKWKQNFEKRLIFGRVLAFLMKKKLVYAVFSKIFIKFSFLMPYMIKQTHGNPIRV